MSKSIFITGASSGIGLATAKLFHDAGWQVAATMRDPKDAASWMTSDRCEVLACDVTDQGSLDAAVKETIAVFGKIDVAFANAGYGLNGPIEGVSEEQIHRQFDVNVYGVARTIKAVAPDMRAREDGLIITTSSIGGIIGMPLSPMYISTKHAVEGLIESARFEFAPFNIKLRLLQPGGIKTDFSRRSAEWADHPVYAEAITAGKKMSVDLLDAAPAPAKVAEVVLKMATDGKGRLRYLAKPGPYVAMYKYLPDRLWRWMIQMALRNAAKT
ncbi:SDR family oxidoreductase [Yoonia sp. 208BN28-4]|uniref:SDR family oxidoreductase n=1 Tax=Yoonia sp. 208BN28-4 TaxID=3126505 RepID=UPI0030A38F4C